MRAYWFGYRRVDWEGSSVQVYQLENDFGRLPPDEIYEGVDSRRAVTAWLNREAVFFRASDAAAKLCHNESPPPMIIDPNDDSETVVIRAIRRQTALMIGI